MSGLDDGYLYGDNDTPLFYFMVALMLFAAVSAIAWAAIDSQKYNKPANCEVVEEKDFYEPDGTKRIVTVEVCKDEV